MQNAEEISTPGFFCDTDGKPLEGACVRVWEASGLPRVKTYTDAEGRFRFPVSKPGSRFFVVTKEGRLYACRGAIPDRGPRGFVCSSSTEEKGTLEGSVVDGVIGNPFQADMVRIMDQDDVVLCEEPTGPDGRFGLGGLTGGHYKIVAAKEGHGVG
ncbi:MAG: carboxypeptidase regulatory-like domain-containing protein, partial [Firmicutes bacterium]|nr:carboxypeptidase regulatory-like domain-containing protein [Bacillota bacterium]